MNEAEKQLQRINEARINREERTLPYVGFNYAEAMAIVVEHVGHRYSNAQIASAIGYAPGSGKMVNEIMKHGAVPSHIQGEALAGWCVDILMKSQNITERQAWERITSQRQRDGGTHPMSGN